MYFHFLKLKKVFELAMILGPARRHDTGAIAGWPAASGQGRRVISDGRRITGGWERSQIERSGCRCQVEGSDRVRTGAIRGGEERSYVKGSDLRPGWRVAITSEKE